MKKNTESTLSQDAALSIQEIIKSQNNSAQKYNIYSRRAALLLETYKEQILNNLDYNSVPTNIANELISLNMMSSMLEPVLKGFNINEVGYTLDGCLVRKEKVSRYNNCLKDYAYYNGENLKIIPYDADNNYEWVILTEEDLKVYEKEAKNILIPEEAEEFVCRIELIRHAQPYDVSLKLMEIRKSVQKKCNLNIKGKIIEFPENKKVSTQDNEQPTLTPVNWSDIQGSNTSALFEEDMVEQMAIELKNIMDKFKKSYKNSALVRRIKSVKENYKK
ncbi:MAG: hypothetical protein IJO33_02975 [Bacilli bacterium]|nr:hypothetical protein [Bacilli bacterium]